MILILIAVFIVVILVLAAVMLPGQRNNTHSDYPYAHNDFPKANNDYPGTSKNYSGTKGQNHPANFVDTSEFDDWKSLISNSCNEQDFDEFFEFLQKYKGGYIRRKNGQIILQEYKNSEKGDLKGIFYHVIVPSRISTGRKEQFRHFLISIGVNGVLDRPDYEGREGKLSVKNLSGEELEKKQSGNLGESIIRRELAKLPAYDFKVLNGIVLKSNGVTREYDHIVIGKTGVFSLETKAFGLNGSVSSEENESAASSDISILINRSDEWTLQKHVNKQTVNRPLPCPTEQITGEKLFLEDILSDYLIEVHPVLVLANENLKLKNSADHKYDIVKVRDLRQFIMEYPDTLNDGDRMMGLQMIVEHRIN